MKAARVHAIKDIRIDDIDIPEIIDGEILIRVKACGICGSDIPRVLGNGAHFYPVILGHEFSGIVKKVSKSINNVGVGDRVSVAPLVPCNICEDCKKGYFAQCSNYSFIGSRRQGGLAEFVAVPAINTVKLPENASYVQGALYEPVSVALHGLMILNSFEGEDVAVLGVGTIGMLALQCAKILKAKSVTAFDIDDEKLRIAREYGADQTVNTKDCDMDKYERNFGAVIETAGVEFTEILALQLAKNHGQVMYIGTPSKSITLTPKQFEHINRKELYVRGSWMSYSSPWPGDEWTLAAKYLAEGRIKFDKILDRIISLNDLPKAFDDMENGKIKGKIIVKM